MNSFTFSKQQQGLFSYVDIVRPNATVRNPLIGLTKELYSYHLNQYLSLAEYLLSGLAKFVMLKATPYIKQAISTDVSCLSNWNYYFLANDFNGLGIDKGFIDTNVYGMQQQYLTMINDLTALKQIPEDNLGDNVSHISFFGLIGHDFNDLKNFLQAEKSPALGDFLQEGELFINILVSKEEGYCHAMLIKSSTDIEDKLDAFQNVIASDN